MKIKSNLDRPDHLIQDTTMQKWMAVVLCVWTLCASLTGIASADSSAARHGTVPSYKAQLITDMIEQKPTRRFHCNNRVNLMITWYKVYGPHRITALWINPAGQQQESTELNFIGRDEETDCWLALEFLNVNNGNGRKAFNGRWQVQILLDSRPLETQEFDVDCG